jgi:Ca-activated chloride channel family protein
MLGPRLNPVNCPAGGEFVKLSRRRRVRRRVGLPAADPADEMHGGRKGIISYSMKRLATLGLLAACLLLAGRGLWAQQSPAPTAQAQPPAARQSPQPESQSEMATTLIVDVSLVNVYVTVTDEHGAPVGGLKKENFILLEDAHAQKISVFDKESALPVSIALAIDTSLSTRHDLPLEQASAKRFAHAILRPVDALAVYDFSEVVHDDTRGFTPDLKRIDESIDHIRMGAATALYDAICLAARALDRRRGRKVIVLITDGEDTVSKVDYKEAVRAAQEAEALVYSLIIVPIESSAGRETGGEHALVQLSEDTGGKYYYATSMVQLDEAFRKISDELRTQYLLAYYPLQRTSFSEFRRIEVKVAGVPDAAAYHVRHRAGYYTVKSQF